MSTYWATQHAAHCVTLSMLSLPHRDCGYWPPAPPSADAPAHLLWPVGLLHPAGCAEWTALHLRSHHVWGQNSLTHSLCHFASTVYNYNCYCYNYCAATNTTATTNITSTATIFMAAASCWWSCSFCSCNYCYYYCQLLILLQIVATAIIAFIIATVIAAGLLCHYHC